MPINNETIEYLKENLTIDLCFDLDGDLQVALQLEGKNISTSYVCLSDEY